MTVKVPPHDPDEFLDELDIAAGRGHVARLLNRAEGFDQIQYEYWRAYLTEMALSAFKWSGVPESIDTRAMEYILLHYGILGLFTESGGHLAAQCSYSNVMNMYYNPNEVWLFAPNGQTWTRHADVWVSDGEVMDADVAVCFDNMLRVPLVRYIDNYARRLAKYDRVADLNIDAQKTPWIVAGTEETKRTRKAVIRKLDSADQYIEVNSAPGLGGDVLPYVLNTAAPFVADKVIEVKQKVLNEALTLLGVDNTNNEKRERQITDEVLANNEQIALMRRSRLECRKRFCETANRMFDLDMDVTWGVPHLFEAPGTDEGAYDMYDEEVDDADKR